jgi:hypothetical protein
VLEDAEIVMAEWTGLGTHEGVQRPPLDRAQIRVQGEMSTFVVADSRLQEERRYYNRMEIVEQLGFSTEWGHHSVRRVCSVCQTRRLHPVREFSDRISKGKLDGYWEKASAIGSAEGVVGATLETPW